MAKTELKTASVLAFVDTQSGLLDRQSLDRQLALYTGDLGTGDLAIQRWPR